MILYTSCYSVSSVSSLSLHLCTRHHLQSTLFSVFLISSDKIIGSLLIDSGNETEVLEICDEHSKTHSSSDIVI